MAAYDPSIASTRRQLLKRAGGGFGLVALADLLRGADLIAGEAASTSKPAPAVSPLAARPAHFTAKAKRVIWLFMNGGQSQVDTWDYKPTLAKLDGKRSASQRIARASLPTRPAKPSSDCDTPRTSSTRSHFFATVCTPRNTRPRITRPRNTRKTQPRNTRNTRGEFCRPRLTGLQTSGTAQRGSFGLGIADCRSKTSYKSPLNPVCSVCSVGRFPCLPWRCASGRNKM